MGPVLSGQSRRFILFTTSHVQVGQLRHYVAYRHRHQRLIERCPQNCQQLLQLCKQLKIQDESDSVVESGHQSSFMIFHIIFMISLNHNT